MSKAGAGGGSRSPGQFLPGMRSNTPSPPKTHGGLRHPHRLRPPTPPRRSFPWRAPRHPLLPAAIWGPAGAPADKRHGLRFFCEQCRLACQWQPGFCIFECTRKTRTFKLVRNCDADHSPHIRLKRAPPFPRSQRIDAGEQLCALAADEFGEDGVLIREVLIEGAGAYAGALCNGVRGEGLWPSAFQNASGSFQNGVHRVARAFLAGLFS